METPKEYKAKGFAVVRGLVSREVTHSILSLIQNSLRSAPRNPVIAPNPAMTKPVIEMYAYHYKPMLSFLWGLTPTARLLTGRDLLPAYAYFRVYQKGDILRVHSDRPACEHSMSLALGSSEEIDWPLEIGLERLSSPQPLQDNFGGAPHLPVNLSPGDALLYRGIDHAHGRTMPNPNGWSAHMFLHWVERDGPHAGHAYGGEPPSAPEDFNFG